MTRLTPDQVKPFILHPERMVRDAAARYFADAHSPDPTVMPLAVQAYEKYGLADAFGGAVSLGQLAQTAETVNWLIATAPRVQGRAEYTLRKALVDATPALLLPLRSAVLKALAREPADVADVKLRLDLTTWDGDRLWRRLAELCEMAGEDDSDERDFAWDEVEWIAEELGRRGGEHTARALDILARPLDPDAVPERDVWLVSAAVRMAGEGRLAAAARDVVTHLHNDWEILDIEAERALVRIGTDDVIRAIEEDWADADASTGFKFYGWGILGNVHTDLAVETCMRLFEAENDDEHKDFLGSAAVGHLSPEVAGRMLDAVAAAAVGYETAAALPPACALLGIETPLVAELRAELLETHRRMDAMAIPRSASPSAPPPKPSAFDLPPLDQPLPILGKTAEAGRNDKCPCGSGKKYKKCCLGKKRA